MEALKMKFIDFFSYVFAQITTVEISDVIDIALVSIIIYYAFVFIRDRRAGKLAIGVLVMVVLQIISGLLDMRTMKFILENVFQVGLIAIIVVFQPELRSALEKVGTEPLKGFKGMSDQKNVQAREGVVSCICDAVCDLSKDKTGALIVIERGTKIGDVIKSGTVIDAESTPFLLKNIFFKNAPLHDGAVVIRGGRIYAAGCFLPLSTNSDIIKDLGTRHRAAIGMSENSDAVVVVVSEENGTISVACEGNLKRNFNFASLRRELLKLLVVPENDSQKSVGSKIKLPLSIFKKKNNTQAEDEEKED